jgi:hypothetical protein
MNSILLEIKENVVNLTPKELNDFRNWFIDCENHNNYDKKLILKTILKHSIRKLKKITVNTWKIIKTIKLRHQLLTK